MILPSRVVAVAVDELHAEPLSVEDENESAKQDRCYEDADDDKDVLDSHVRDPGREDEDEDCGEQVAGECDAYERVANDLEDWPLAWERLK